MLFEKNKALQKELSERNKVLQQYLDRMNDNKEKL